MIHADHSGMLWRKIRLGEGRLFSASDSFWRHPDLQELLPRFLVQLHCVMSGSMLLMTAARDRARLLRGDRVAEIVARYLDAHIEEEKDHDDWLLADLETIGVTRDEVRETLPSAAVISLMAAQSVWMFHAHPVALFGYLAVLEGYPPLAHQLHEIKVRTGYPDTAFRCLMAHAEDDPNHIAEINNALDEMPLSPEQTQLVGLSALHTIDAISCVLDELSGIASESLDVAYA